MNRRTKRKVSQFNGKEKVVVVPPVCLDQYEVDDCNLSTIYVTEVDWTKLPDDTVLHIFHCLNYRDRASLSSSCRYWRVLGSSPCLWMSIDLRAHHFDSTVASSLAARCSSIQRLQFRGHEPASALINLKARNLKEISGDFCRNLTDSTLSIMAARHELLETLQIGPEPCEKITSDAIQGLAICCPRLKRIRLSGIAEIHANAIKILARHCGQLEEIAFLDCGSVDATELGNVTSLRLLSVAGTRNIDWLLASVSWSKLPNLSGLDVSRTDVSLEAVSRFLAIQSLKVLCVLNCLSLEMEYHNQQFISSTMKDKVLLSLFTDIVKGIDLLSPVCNITATPLVKDKKNIFDQWSIRKETGANEKIDDIIMNWLEWILSQCLLRIAESNPSVLEDFWLHQGVILLLNMLKSSQEDVQERAATGLATFVVVEDENVSVNPARAEAVMKDGGIPLLLKLAKSCNEGIQTEATKAIANLSVEGKQMASGILRSPPSSLLSSFPRLLRFSPPSAEIFNCHEGCVASRFLGSLAFDEIRVSDDVTRPYTATALVLHGLLGSGRNWKSFTRNLAVRLRTTATSNSSQDWRFVLVDLRNHGKSAGIMGLDAPHDMENTARDLANLVNSQQWSWPDVVIGHSMGGKVALEFAKSCSSGNYGKSAMLPKQLWVLDSIPGEVNTDDSDGEVEKVIQALGSLPKILPSRRWVVDHMLELGFSKSLSEWIGSNLKNEGGQVIWAFDIQAAISMFNSYRQTCYWSFLENPPKGSETAIVRAEKSDRWSPQVLQRLENLSRKVQGSDQGKVSVHTLQNSGHWVHVDNPMGLLEIMAPKFLI